MATILEYEITGSHTGANNAAVLTDSAASFLTRRVHTNDVIYNLTDGSSATITNVTATTISGALAGGAQNDWDTGDLYRIWVSEPNKIRHTYTDTRGFPASSTITVCSPLDIAKDTYLDYQKIRLKDEESGLIYFYGKLEYGESAFDASYGQVINLFVRDNLSELLKKVINTNYSTMRRRGRASPGPSGTHNGAANAASLTDTTKNFVALGVLVGDSLRNATDVSTTTITAITTTTNPNDTLVGVLAGGTENDWDVGDSYIVEPVGLINSIISELRYSSSNIDDSNSSKFETSTVLEAAGVLDQNFVGTGKTGLKVIQELANEDPWDTTPTGFGYDFYLDTTFSGSTPAPEANYFKRGTRPSNSDASQVWRVDADAGPAFTDETADFSSSALNDVSPFPVAEAIGDSFEIGFTRIFAKLQINVGTAGTGAPTVVWEYWNGAAFVALSGVTDGTSAFTITGTHDVTFTAASDWATTSRNGSPQLYYVRARLTAIYGATDPLITQGWISGALANGLTVELNATEADQRRSMFMDYHFPTATKELITQVRVEYVDDSVASQTKTIFLLDVGTRVNPPFAIGSVITGGTSGTTAVVEYDGGSFICVSTLTGTGLWTIGETISAGIITASVTRSPRQSFEQDIETVLRGYNITDVNEARKKAAQLLYHGGDTITRGTFKIARLPYYKIGGAYTQVRAGDVIRVKNTNLGLDEDMLVTKVTLDEGPGIWFSIIDVLRIGRGVGAEKNIFEGLDEKEQTALWNSFVRSNSSSTRVEFNNNGLFGYNAGTKMFYLQSSDGKAYFAGGRCYIDANGITFVGDGGLDNFFHFYDGATFIADFYSAVGAFLVLQSAADKLIKIIGGGGLILESQGAYDLELVVDTGKVKFGAHTAIGAETVTGFITIKDELGNERKLAVVS